MLDYNDHYSNSDHSSPYNREVTRNKVITDYAKAIELNPDYQNTYQHGWSYVRIGEYDTEPLLILPGSLKYILASPAAITVGVGHMPKKENMIGPLPISLA